MDVKTISTPSAPSPAGLANYSQARVAGDSLWLAGQVATDFINGVAPEDRVDPNFPYYSSAIGKQTEYILKNCDILLREAGSDLDHLVKAQVFLIKAEDFLEFDKAWKRHVREFPARTTVEIMPEGLLVIGALVKIDLTSVAK